MISFLASSIFISLSSIFIDVSFNFIHGTKILEGGALHTYITETSCTVEELRIPPLVTESHFLVKITPHLQYNQSDEVLFHNYFAQLFNTKSVAGDFVNLFWGPTFKSDNMSTGSTFSDFVICNTAIILGITQISPMFQIYTPWKCYKIKCFLTFSEGI